MTKNSNYPIEKEIKKVKEKIYLLDEKIHSLNEEKLAAINYLNGLEFSYKNFSKESSSSSQELRPGTELAQIREILLASGKPLHINEILSALGITDMKRKPSLSGSLTSYSKQHRIFTKTGSNTFGLIEMKYDDKE